MINCVVTKKECTRRSVDLSSKTQGLGFLYPENNRLWCTFQTALLLPLSYFPAYKNVQKIAINLLS